MLCMCSTVWITSQTCYVLASFWHFLLSLHLLSNNCYWDRIMLFCFEFFCFCLGPHTAVLCFYNWFCAQRPLGAGNLAWVRSIHGKCSILCTITMTLTIVLKIRNVQVKVLCDIRHSKYATSFHCISITVLLNRNYSFQYHYENKTNPLNVIISKG